MIVIGDTEFQQLVSYVKTHCGLDLSGKKHLIEGRLQNVLAIHNFTSFAEYYQYVTGDRTGQAVVSMINKLTTNHTYFLREREHFDLFRDQTLPYLAKTVANKDLRIWSAGCSSGEEPYTLAMIINDYFGEKKWLWDSRILATDISRKALDIGIEGVYSDEQVAILPETWRKKYLRSLDGDKYQMNDKIRSEVIFRAFNLNNAVYPFKRKFHVIFCRNVMIYFDMPTKQKLLEQFYEFTEPGGYLFIGHAESIGRDQTKYKYIVPAVYRKE